MQTLNTVRLEDKLVTPDDLSNCVPVTATLSTAVAALSGQYFFLSEVCRIEVVNPGAESTYEVLLPGKIYKCVEEYVTDPNTGLRVVAYRWQSVSFKENGKLAKPENFTIRSTANASTIGGYTKQLWWEDPVDVTNSDPSQNAIWAYTIIVRKRGSSMPSTPFDGDVVGYSSIRNQYKSGAVGFPDLVPVEGYSYNVFAVTRYGIATGSTDSGGTEMDWNELRALIRAGNAASVLSIGDAVVVHHDQFGDITLRVVDMNMATVDTSLTTGAVPIMNGVNPVTDDAGRPLYYSVTFMSTTSMIRAQYDTNELATSAAGVDNPGDGGSYGSAKNCSTRGRCDWKTSNLRYWFNQVSTYNLSSDTKYNTHKCYYTRTGSGTTEDPYTYTPVPTPIDPATTNPSTLGYYEASWYFDQDTTHPWDKKPDCFKSVDPDAGYVFNERELPGFLTGFSSSFVNSLAYVKVTTVTDPFLYDHKAALKCYNVTSDRVFIPSYRELYGKEPPGIRDVGATSVKECHEGNHFKFYNPSYDIPGLTLYDRSYLMRDLSGFLSGYYMRTPETDKNSAGDWVQSSPSGLQCVISDGYTTPPQLSTAITPFGIVGCKMTVAESKAVNVDNVYTAPGIAWCCVIA